MKILRIICILILTMPVLGFGQLKKDVPTTNVSNTLITSAKYDNSLLGLLDPARLQMHHSFSMSYMSLGGNGIMLNSYVNTIDYKFSDNLFLTTKLGLMASPVNNLPNKNMFNDTQFFGGAEIRYLPTENSSVILRFESVPYLYTGPSMYNWRNSYLDW
jgi:hypothetical protein